MTNTDNNVIVLKPSDVKVIEEVKVTPEVIEEAKASLADAKETLEKAEAVAEATAAAIDDVKHTLDDMSAELGATIKENEEILEELEGGKKKKKEKVLNATPLNVRAEIAYREKVQPVVDSVKHAAKQEYDERVDDVKFAAHQVKQNAESAPFNFRRHMRDLATNIRTFKL